jgi:glycosyltransferase involved in cell wall biosynthesis
VASRLIQAKTHLSPRRFVSYYPRAVSETSGVTVALWAWASALAAAGHEVVVLHAGGTKPSPVDGLTVGVRHRSIPHFGSARRSFLPIGLERYLAPGDLLVLHEGWVLSNLMAARVARRARVDYVLIPHGAYEPGIRQELRRPRRIRELFERQLLEGALAVHVFFESEIPSITALAPRARFVVAPTGFELPADRWTGGGGYISWLGRYDPVHKGLDVLIRAVNAIPEGRRPRLRLHGPDYKGGFKSIRQLIANLELDRWVEASEAVSGPEKATFLRRADGYVHPSRWESHSIALLENLALGVPCLVSEAIHIAPGLERANAALLVAPTVDALAEGMMQLTVSEGAVGERGRAFIASQLSWKRVIGNLLDGLQSSRD